MKKKELKEMLRPIVRECIEECIHEALFDSGIITSVVSEVIKGVNIPQLVESVSSKSAPVVSETKRYSFDGPKAERHSASQEAEELKREHEAEMQETKRRLEEGMKSRLGGINIFEGTTPTIAESNEHSPMSGVDPNDPGINLKSIPGLKNLDFKQHIKE